MGSVFDVIYVPAASLAITGAFVTVADIPSQITPMLDTVYEWLPGSGLQQVGHNYAIYDQFGSDGMSMRGRFPVSAPFEHSQSVTCLPLSDCFAARTVHLGPYADLPIDHAALNQWCDE